IEDPDCFWVIIKGCSPFLDHEVDYQKLNSAMNDFYNRMCQDIEIKPLKLEEGQVCVVYCQELKCWCRAVIKSIMSSADHYLAECFLVDFARYVPVKSKNIRVAIETFMQLPYRAKKFRLYCTKPVTLHINFCEDSAEIVRAKKWDIAAIQYFQNILKATTQVEAKLCAVEEDTFEVYLYVTLKNEKVCVNDDLVAKNFACYVSPMENKNFDSLETPRLNIKSASFSNKLNPALSLWPMFLQGKGSQRMEKSCGLTFLAESLQHPWPQGAGDLRPTSRILGEMCLQCRRPAWVESLGQEDPLEKGRATHALGNGYSCLGNPMDGGACMCSVIGVRGLSCFAFSLLQSVLELTLHIFEKEKVDGKQKKAHMRFISSSVIPFSSCPQPLPASGSFPRVNSSHEVAKVLEFQLQHHT
ncbi:hypothetical protein FD755_003912, partial [Muntiacus reevesi]